MTNDYKKGHAYRMRTDADYRKRHDGTIRAPERNGPKTCRCGNRATEYHHPEGNRVHGRWICKTCHKKIHGSPRGKTPYR